MTDTEQATIDTVERVGQLLPDLDTAIRRADIINTDHSIDGRAGDRLSAFVPVDRWGEIGITLRDDVTPEQIAEAAAEMRPWTPEAVAEQIGKDVAFAFTKALDQRGISASSMHTVCMMWARILGLEINPGNYAEYGLPGIKALALALGLPNQIGDDRGDESRYAG
jgi:hypothetical protein